MNFSVSQTHTAGCFSITQVNPDAQEVGGTGSFAPLAAYTVFCARGGGNLLGSAAIPGYHLQNVSRAGADALGAADAGIVNFNAMRH